MWVRGKLGDPEEQKLVVFKLRLSRRGLGYLVPNILPFYAARLNVVPEMSQVKA